MLTHTCPAPGDPCVVGTGEVAEFVAGTVAAPAVGGVVEGAAVSHDLTPPCPLHAPDRVVPEYGEPSLQVAVTVAVCAWAARDNARPTAVTIIVR